MGVRGLRTITPSLQEHPLTKDAQLLCDTLNSTQQETERNEGPLPRRQGAGDAWSSELYLKQTAVDATCFLSPCIWEAHLSFPH